MVIKAFKILSMIPGIGIILYFLLDIEGMDLCDRIEYLCGGRPYNEPKDAHWPRD